MPSPGVSVHSGTAVVMNPIRAASENITTRLFFGYTNLGFDVAGPLTNDASREDHSLVCLI